MPKVGIDEVIDAIKDGELNQSTRYKIRQLLIKALGGKSVIEVSENEEKLLQFVTVDEFIRINVEKQNENLEVAKGIFNKFKNPNGGSISLKKISVSELTDDEKIYLGIIDEVK